MIKKLLSISLLLLLATALTACGGNRPTAERTNTTKPTQNESANKTDKNDFNEATNVKLDFYGYKYSIPAYWTEGKNRSDLKCYYAETGDSVVMLQLNCSSSPVDSIDEFMEQIDRVLDNFRNEFDDFKAVNYGMIQLGNIDSVFLDFNAATSDFNITGKNVFFITDKKLISISLVQSDNSKYNYFEDYDKIIHSIRGSDDELEDSVQDASGQDDSVPGASEQDASVQDGSVQDSAEPDDLAQDDSEPDDSEQTSDYSSDTSSLSYSDGMYKIGVDMPAGEYVIKTFSHGYFELCSDSTGTVDSIIVNDNFKTNTIITVSDGQYLTINRATAYPSDQVSDLDIYDEGMFRVGIDLPAGEYKIHANNSGYVEVSSDSSHQFRSIVMNDNFEGDKYVTVSDGQYLTLNRAAIVQ